MSRSEEKQAVVSADAGILHSTKKDWAIDWHNTSHIS